MQSILDGVIEDLPDEALLERDLFGGQEEESLGNEGMGPDINFKTARLLMMLSPTLPIIFLLLLTLFGVRSIKDFLLWWGIPFLVAGLLALGLSLTAMPVLNWGLETFAMDRIPGMVHPDFTQMAFDILRTLVQSFICAVAIQAGVITILGLFLTGGAIFIIFSTSKE
jgi:hypothetical protein